MPYFRRGCFLPGLDELVGIVESRNAARLALLSALLRYDSLLVGAREIEIKAFFLGSDRCDLAFFFLLDSTLYFVLLAEELQVLVDWFVHADFHFINGPASLGLNEKYLRHLNFKKLKRIL